MDRRSWDASAAGNLHRTKIEQSVANAQLEPPQDWLTVPASEKNSGRDDQTNHEVMDDLIEVMVLDMPWERGEAVGEGEEYRAESKRGDHASPLSFHDTVVHGSLVAAV